MFIELIDVLRCTRPHEDTWLVAAFDRLVDRNVVEGLLSCPVCGARYPIADGVAYFDVPTDTAPAAGGSPPDSAEEMAVRAAAFLSFVEGETMVLAGLWARGAAKLAKLGARVVTLNAGDEAAYGVSRIRTSGILPCAANSLHGVALDATTASALDSAARSLKPKGRLVAPAAAPLPDGMTEIARDAEWWIAERSAENVSAPITLRRG